VSSDHGYPRPPLPPLSAGRGLFVVFEGLDGAGTTSQSTLLANWLREHDRDVELTHEPSHGPTGVMLRSVLGRRMTMDVAALALAFAADRLDHLYNDRNGLVGRLASGSWVVCDRYVLSSLAYQASQGLDPDWLVSINQHAIQPDVTVFVDAAPSVCLARIGRRSSDDELFHGHAQLGQVQESYREILRRGMFVGGLITVDGDEPMDIVAKQVRAGLVSWIVQNEPALAATFGPGA